MEPMKFLVLLVLSIAQMLFIIQHWDVPFHIFSICCFLTFLIYEFKLSRPSSPVYLVDFACLKPPSFCRISSPAYLEHVRLFDFLDKPSVAFIDKVLTHSGQGEQTYLPPSLHYIPPKSGLEDALDEVHLVLFPIFEDLLSRAKLCPKDIDILIVNCSGFCPVPSLSSIIINKFSMREDVKSFNLTGMGCSASALAIDMAQNILKTHRNSNAVILSTEVLSTGWYPGKDRPMMVLNCLFRMGGAAILLTNRIQAKWESKYKLIMTQRTQRAFEDKGYYSAIREEDSSGITGFTLRRDLLQVAGDTLRSNIAILGANILPVTEQIWYAVSIFRKKFVDKSTEVYVPDFKSVIQHFCLPTSGKPVIKEISKGLKLGEVDMEPALMTLHRFGNQSSSSLWYELAYMEAKGRIKKGDKVWMLGMGSGPKCISLVLECCRPIFGEASRGPWADTIEEYPITPQS
ncbi:OLC1v1027286C1 [Oldenlandia corymbosa var. corymbosa]|uniref:3-ketoacyl-CoA synthase n=1 Tax=Oldenlandia corymbosa var. corymbosa TaxID=529605 RepID=A0AAV1C9L6_OLDCO|nr:OLC1v1027286C1 [Oldenlandia corymbosa var. corymbosa]